MPPTPPSVPAALVGLELLSSAVVLADRALTIRYINPAAENLFAVSQRRMGGKPLACLLGPATEVLDGALRDSLRTRWTYTGQDLHIQRSSGEPLYLDCTVSRTDLADFELLLEFRPIDTHLRVAREEKLLQQQQINRELIRNLAHEIKNPLGGIRGSAQLLEHELTDPQLREYTSVIIAEADRLQELMNRMLSAHVTRRMHLLNIHDVLERVRRLLLAEFPHVNVVRDYDTSLPPVQGDDEQLIQAVLNIGRNAAQVLEGRGDILLRTRVARQVTIAKRLHKLALELQVIDDGPGIPDSLRDTILYPLVTGREGGSGLGLSLAQSFVEQHQGMIEAETRNGLTCFTILLPLAERA